MKAKLKNELQSLTDRMLSEGGLSTQEIQRLQFILQDPGAQKEYFQLIEIHSYLSDAAIAQDMIAGQANGTYNGAYSELATSPMGPVANNITPFPSSLQPKQSRSKLLTFSSIAAACQVASLLFAFLYSTYNSDKVDQTVQNAPENTAIVNNSNGVVWSKIPDNFGATSSIEIEQGLVSLTHQSGVTVLIEGPAHYQVTGTNSGEVLFGKCVAEVPKGAEGFTLKHPAGKVVDLGTKFAVEADMASQVQVGVFDGKVEVHNPKSKEPLLLKGKQATKLSKTKAPTPPQSFKGDHFFTAIPNSEFSWSLGKTSKEFTFDVSKIVLNPGEYFTAVRTLKGDDVAIEQISLLKDNQVIASSADMGLASVRLNSVGNNLYRHQIAHRYSAKTKLLLKVKLKPKNTNSGSSSGLIHFNRMIQATERDFEGTWIYSAQGKDNWKRIHQRDRTVGLFAQGADRTDGFANCKWRVENGVFYVPTPRGPEELCILKDRKTMILLNQPYGNAKKQE